MMRNGKARYCRGTWEGLDELICRTQGVQDVVQSPEHSHLYPGLVAEKAVGNVVAFVLVEAEIARGLQCLMTVLAPAQN